MTQQVTRRGLIPRSPLLELACYTSLLEQALIRSRSVHIGHTEGFSGETGKRTGELRGGHSSAGTGRHWLGIAIGSVVLGSCAHSSSFVTGDYLNRGPYQTIGDEQQLTVGGGSSPVWLLDGKGIFYLAPNSSPFSMSSCFSVLPPDGGNALWLRCGGAEPLGFNEMSFFTAAAVGPNGALLYVEVVGHRPPWAPPVGYRAHLWLGDTARQPQDDRRVLQLYRDSIGHPLVPQDSVNWLVHAQWAAPDTFYAVGQNVTPADQLTTLGIEQGTVDTGGATLRLLPGTGDVHLYSVGSSGHTVVFADTGLVLWTTGPEGGNVSPFAEIPAAQSRTIDDLSCAGTRCLVLTHETRPTPAGGRQPSATVWRLDLADAKLDSVRAFTGFPLALPTGIALAPTSDDGVVVQGGQLYLIKNLATPSGG